jgi:hypothetical protein
MSEHLETRSGCHRQPPLKLHNAFPAAPTLAQLPFIERTVASVSATVNGTGCAQLSCTVQNGTLNFAAVETTKTVSVPVVDDTATTAGEPHETFFMNLSGPTNGAVISTGQATGTIVDWNICNS